MDVVLVGLPGSGKSVIGKRLAQRHRASFIDLDERIESADRPVDPGDLRGAGRGRVPDPRAAGRRGPGRTRSGPGDPPGRGDRRRGRRRPAQPLAPLPGPRLGLARRPTGGPRPAPAPVARMSARSSPDGIRSGRSGTWPPSASASTPRRPSGARAWPRCTASSTRSTAASTRWPRPSRCRAATLLQAETPIGRFVLGEGIAHDAVIDALERLSARRAILVSEPGAWAAFGETLSDGLAAEGWTVERVMLPQGEDAKRLAVIETASAGPRAAARGARRAARRDRRRRARRCGRVPGGDVPARACRSSTCRRRWSPRSTRRSAARRASTCPRARTWSGRSTSRPRSSSMSRPCGRCRSDTDGPPSARRSRWPRSATSGCSSCWRSRAPRSPAARRRPSTSGAVAEVVERCAWAKVDRSSWPTSASGTRAADGSP